MPAFQPSEYRARTKKVRQVMADRGLDALLVMTESNMNYLTGYDGYSEYVPQLALVLQEEEDPVLRLREMDLQCAYPTSYLPDTKILAYPESFIGTDKKTPWEPIAAMIRERTKSTRIGCELTDNWQIVPEQSTSAIVVHHPEAKYFKRGTQATTIANREYPLWQVVRASTAAPYFFDPETIRIGRGSDGAKPVTGDFVDGGVSPSNNPSLQALMTRKAFSREEIAERNRIFQREVWAPAVRANAAASCVGPMYHDFVSLAADAVAQAVGVHRSSGRRPSPDLRTGRPSACGASPQRASLSGPQINSISTGIIGAACLVCEVARSTVRASESLQGRRRRDWVASSACRAVTSAGMETPRRT